jgi:hypothetical protein
MVLGIGYIEIAVGTQSQTIRPRQGRNRGGATVSGESMAPIASYGRNDPGSIHFSYPEILRVGDKDVARHVNGNTRR